MRCVYCHSGDNVPDTDDELWDCTGCGAVVHVGCRREATRCATIGCTWKPDAAMPPVVKPIIAPVVKTIGPGEHSAAATASRHAIRCMTCMQVHRGSAYGFYLRTNCYGCFKTAFTHPVTGGAWDGKQVCDACFRLSEPERQAKDRSQALGGLTALVVALVLLSAFVWFVTR